MGEPFFLLASGSWAASERSQTRKLQACTGWLASKTQPDSGAAGAPVAAPSTIVVGGRSRGTTHSSARKAMVRWRKTISSLKLFRPCACASVAPLARKSSASQASTARAACDQGRSRPSSSDTRKAMCWRSRRSLDTSSGGSVQAGSLMRSWAVCTAWCHSRTSALLKSLSANSRTVMSPACFFSCNRPMSCCSNSRSSATAAGHMGLKATCSNSSAKSSRMARASSSLLLDSTRRCRSPAMSWDTTLCEAGRCDSRLSKSTLAPMGSRRGKQLD
mmetsp:Transcript_33645/g.80707  ORF Transcript_33645/g.80707 Transcript_33645/m.80707 type:complete len:275 (+) Transcript_33645:1523-2347(+)